MKVLSITCFLVLCIAVSPALGGESFTSLIEEASSFYDEDDKEYLSFRVSEIVVDMESKGLPTEPVVRKLREGLRKQVLPYNIVQTLESKQGSISEARSMLDEVDPASSDDVDLLLSLALSLEYDVPSSAVREALKASAERDGDRIRMVVQSLSDFLELGVNPQQAGVIVRQVVEKNPDQRDMYRMARLLENARRQGIDPQRTAQVLENALNRYGNLNLVEMEVQSFISDARSRPSLGTGEGAVTSSPGIPGGPTHEGGTEPASPPSGAAPTQEGGAPLDH